MKHSEFGEGLSDELSEFRWITCILRSDHSEWRNDLIKILSESSDRVPSRISWFNMFADNFFVSFFQSTLEIVLYIHIYVISLLVSFPSCLPITRNACFTTTIFRIWRQQPKYLSGDSVVGKERKETKEDIMQFCLGTFFVLLLVSVLLCFSFVSPRFLFSPWDKFVLFL